MAIKRLNPNDDVEPKDALVPTEPAAAQDSSGDLPDALKKSLAKNMAAAVMGRSDDSLEPKESKDQDPKADDTDQLMKSLAKNVVSAVMERTNDPALEPKEAKDPQDAKELNETKIKRIKTVDDDAEAGAGAVNDDGTPTLRKIKIGEDVSDFTGRPRVTEEENQSLRDGVHIAKRAMRTMANARGEEYEPYRIPAKMRAELAQIDIEAEQERKKELEEQRALAAAAGQTLPEEASQSTNVSDPFAQMHSMTPEERENAEKAYGEQARIDAGGARFYGNYQKMMENQEQHKLENNQRIRRNLKLVFMVIICLFAYVGYNTFFAPKSNTQTSIEELKAALPLTIDNYTSMVRIDDRTDVFKIYLEIEPDAFVGLTQAQKEARIDIYGQNARLLCKNPLIHSIISSGRKVTLLLEVSDRSFFREFSIDKCPTDSGAN